MQTWNVLDVGSVWMKEFASALSRQVPVTAWQPRMEVLGGLKHWTSRKTIVDPALEIELFPLQRGYARAPIRWALPFHHRLRDLILHQTPEPHDSPLVCSTPFYAPVAELWPGPVVYYVTDMTAAYPSVNAAQVRALDRRLCRVATTVCPNSRRIAEYLVTKAGCDPGKVTVVPNATRQSNIPAEPLLSPGPLPSDIAGLRRPVIGVMGDLSTNLDWPLLQSAIEAVPSVQWLFVGPSERPIPDVAQSAARERVRSLAHFTGPKPYGELQSYARCFDVAVLPYRKSEPTYSGSSTRFYEHLAAGRPMIATRGFAELLEKEPLVKLVDTADELVEQLHLLQANSFSDGLEAERWEASRAGTWEARACVMREALTSGASALVPTAPMQVQYSTFALR